MTTQADRPMTQDQLKAIEERANAATPGPWHWRKCYELRRRHWAICSAESDARASVASLPFISVDDYTPPDVWNKNADTQFIAHARDDVPALIAEIRRLREQRNELAKVVHQRADAIGFAIDWLTSFNVPPQATGDERDEVLAVLRGEKIAPYPQAAGGGGGEKEQKP